MWAPFLVSGGWERWCRPGTRIAVDSSGCPAEEEGGVKRGHKNWTEVAGFHYLDLILGFAFVCSVSRLIKCQFCLPKEISQRVKTHHGVDNPLHGKMGHHGHGLDRREYATTPYSHELSLAHTIQPSSRISSTTLRPVMSTTCATR